MNRLGDVHSEFQRQLFENCEVRNAIWEIQDLFHDW